MDPKEIEKIVRMMQSASDSDAVMGLRSFQRAVEAAGLDFGKVIPAAFSQAVAEAAKPDQTIEQTKSAKQAAPVAISGTPQCRVPQQGALELIPSGKTSGEIVTLPGVSASHSDAIASNLKDALVAAAINKSRFKLKLMDNKNARGEVIETVLQAEYERGGMSPIWVWVNVRGEVAALATVLRRALAACMPEFIIS